MKILLINLFLFHWIFFILHSRVVVGASGKEEKNGQPKYCCNNSCPVQVKIVRVNAKPPPSKCPKPIVVKSRVVVTQCPKTATKPVCLLSTMHHTTMTTRTCLSSTTVTGTHCCIEKHKKTVTKTTVITATSTVIKPVFVTNWITCKETMLISTVKNMECIQPTTQVTIVMETATVLC